MPRETPLSSQQAPDLKAAAADYKLWKGTKKVADRIKEKYGITLKTLRRKIKSKNLESSKVGAPRKMGQIADDTFCDLLRNAQSSAMSFSKREALKWANQVYKEVQGGAGKPLTSKWLDGFCARHPEFSWRMPRNTSQRRERAFTPEAHASFYELLGHQMDDVPAERVYIMDETHLQVGAKVKVCERNFQHSKIPVLSSHSSLLLFCRCSSRRAAKSSAPSSKSLQCTCPMWPRPVPRGFSPSTT
jgi:hypothetical protein